MNAKNEIESILKKHGFVDSDYKEVFEAMSEILELKIDHLEANKPYATNTIDRLRQVSSDIYDMESFIESFN